MIYERNNNDPIYSTVPGRLGSVTEVSDLTGRIHGPRAEVEERNVPDVEVPVEPHAGDVLILDDDRLADLAGLRVVRRRVWSAGLELMCEAFPRSPT